MKFRYRLRGLLILFGVATVILAVTISGARRNVIIVNTLRSSGAFATFDDGSVPPRKMSLWKPSSVFSFRKISVVQNVLSDDVVESISGLRGLKKVQLASNVTAAGLEQLSRLSSIEELRVDSLRISNDQLAALKDFRNLKTLALSGPQLTDAALAQVAKVKTLQSLELIGTSVTDAGMPNLNGMQALRELDLEKTKISDDGLLALLDLPRLNKINIAETQIKAATVAHIVMDTNGHPFGDWFPARVDESEGRTTLMLGGQHITDDAIPYLIRGLPQTTDIEITETGITSAGLLKFKELPNLKSLQISNAHQITVVENLPHLEELNFRSWTVPQLNDLPKLASLKLRMPRIELGQEGESNMLDPLFDFIANAPKLRHLELDAPISGGLVAENLGRCGSLVELELLDVALRDDQVVHLAKLKNLQSLSISRSQITDVAARQLDDLEQLHYLDLEYNRSVTKTCVSALKHKPEVPDSPFERQHKAMMLEFEEAAGVRME